MTTKKEIKAEIDRLKHETNELKKIIAMIINKL